ncbi:MAG: sugar phosphate isomerase/epimerase [Clostridiaceae bacterium]|jgi:sugar phosphate isomerase/epimerase|nr:sugar phosphate isomerase/epimerase [Clostridiaceae bacterium]
MNKISQTVPLQYDTVFSPFSAGEFSYALGFLKDNGFTGVEIAIAYPTEVNELALSKELERNDLAVTTLSTGQIYGLKGFFLSSPDESIRRQAIQTINGHVELSAMLGYPPVTIGLIRGKLESEDIDKLYDSFRASLIECLEFAYKRNVILQLEPICRNETVLINSTSDALDFLDSLGNPGNLGILYDTYHSSIEDGDMISAIKKAAGKITNVHFSDSNRGLPGEGSIDFRKVYETLKNTGYKGAIALETLSIPSADYVRKNFVKSIFKFIPKENPA